MYFNNEETTALESEGIFARRIREGQSRINYICYDGPPDEPIESDEEEGDFNEGQEVDLP